MYIIYTSNVFAVTCSFDSKRDIGHCNWQRIRKCYCNSNQLINFYWRIQKLNNKKINGVFNCKKICPKLYGMILIDLQKSCWMWIINLRKQLHLYTAVNQANFLSIYLFVWYAHKGNKMYSSETCRYTLWTLTSIYSCVS